jgi:hypothetical protein
LALQKKKKTAAFEASNFVPQRTAKAEHPHTTAEEFLFFVAKILPIDRKVIL